MSAARDRVVAIDGLLLEYLSTGDLGRTTEALRLFDHAMGARAQKA